MKIAKVMKRQKILLCFASQIKLHFLVVMCLDTGITLSEIRISLLWGLSGYQCTLRSFSGACMSDRLWLDECDITDGKQFEYWKDYWISSHVFLNIEHFIACLCSIYIDKSISLKSIMMLIKNGLFFSIVIKRQRWICFISFCAL